MARTPAFRRLAGMYACCWIVFFATAVIVRSNGGVVHLPSAALAPMAPLFVIGRAVAERGAWVAIPIIGVVALPPALIALAVRRPDRPLASKLAVSAMAACWLVLLAAMGLGA